MIGALFGLFLPLLLFIYAAMKLLDMLFPALQGNSVVFIAFPLFIIYFIRIIILDTSHLNPLPLNTAYLPLTYLEKCVASFWNTHFDYFPMKVRQKHNYEIIRP